MVIIGHQLGHYHQITMIFMYLVLMQILDIILQLVKHYPIGKQLLLKIATPNPKT